jgi:hypothetical protein
MVGVQRLRDGLSTATGGAHLKDSTHNDGFGLVDPTLDVRAPAVGVQDFKIVITEQAATGHMTVARFSQHHIVSSLSTLLALQFVGERRQREHDLCTVAR